MRKIKLVAVLMVLLCGTALSAKDFKWSESWCNYGAGIEKGDFLINADVGLAWLDLAYPIGYTNGWFCPPVIVDVQYATPIWKLPFTFGGYAGFRGHGYKELVGYEYPNGFWGPAVPVYQDKACWDIFFGFETAYHAMMPIETIDVYASLKLGASIPIGYTYFNPLDYVPMGFSLGANWFFAKNVGLNLEFGYPFTKFGFTFKI